MSHGQPPHIQRIVPFTPGPWSLCNWMVGNNTPTGEVTICGPEGDEHICTMDGNENNQANATLIAAAPAMYEALAKLRLEAIHYRNTGVGVQFLNHAIDQAELAINQVWGGGGE